MKSTYRQSLSFSRPVAKGTASGSKAFAALLLAALSVCWGVRAEVVVSRYAVTLSGIPTGEVILQTKYNAKQYEVAVWADVGTILDSTKIKGLASGARAGVKLTPERFQLVLSGGEEGTIDVNFKGSGGTDATINPRLKGVFDPLSALLLTSLKPLSPAGNPCNHLLPIFTGRSRFDLSLHPEARRRRAEKVPDRDLRSGLCRYSRTAARKAQLGNCLHESAQAAFLAAGAYSAADGQGHCKH